MSINALFHPATPADVPRQPSDPGDRPPAVKKSRIAELSIGFVAAGAIDAGTKSTVIVAVARHPHAVSLAPGGRLTFKVQARSRRHRRDLAVDVTSVCPHDFLGDIPACGHGHDAATINPANPTWAFCLGYAANRGANPLPPRERNRLAASGWVVVSFDLAKN